MPKEIRLNAFAMNCVAHQSPGLWTHPRDRTAEYNRLPYWIDLAKTLERGRFDGLFLADVLGVYDVYGGSPDAALRNATQTPANEPLMLIPAMAAVTEASRLRRHLQSLVRAALPVCAPDVDARSSHRRPRSAGTSSPAISTAPRAAPARTSRPRMTTATTSRMNIWSWSTSSGRAAGRTTRCCATARAGIFADPAKVHRIVHEGNNYKLNAIHLGEPSPQRTPVLYQAGTSPRGRQFAAEHAECVFMSGPSAKMIGPRVAAIRELAAEAGRNPAEILMFSMFTMILGRTEAEAKAKYEDYRSHINPGGRADVDVGLDRRRFLADGARPAGASRQNDAGRSAMDNITRADPDRVWTVREVAQHVGIGGIGPVVVGTPEKVADEIEAWFEADRRRRAERALCGVARRFRGYRRHAGAGADPPRPLQDGVSQGTLREKLFGAGRARLNAQHPAARYRPGVSGEGGGVAGAPPLVEFVEQRHPRRHCERSRGHLASLQLRRWIASIARSSQRRGSSGVRFSRRNFRPSSSISFVPLLTEGAGKAGR